MKNKTILILGATGTIGCYTALYLKKHGYNIIACGKRENDNGFFKTYDIQYIQLDITDKSQFNKLVNTEINTILHCAGSMPAAMSGYNPQNHIDSILTGTYNVLEYAKNNKISKIAFTHSHADSLHLGGNQTPIPSDIEKKFPLKGDHSIYSICKNAAADLIEHYYHEHGIKRFILRLPTIYAYHPNPYFHVNGQKQWIAYRYIMELAKKGKDIEVWGNPEKRKEITYIDDLCEIFRLLIESDKDGGVYNVGRGIGVSLLEQIEGIVETFSPAEKKSKLIFCKDKPDAKEFIHDITKLTNDLGYSPKYDYIKLLKEFKKEEDLNRFEKLWGVPSDYQL